MFSAIANFFRRLFEGGEARVKRLAYAAGILVGANNAKYITTAKIIYSHLATANKEENTLFVNGLFKKLFSEVMQEAEKPEQKAALAILFSELNFSPDIDAVPDIKMPLIKSAVVGFLEGMTI